MRVVGINPGPVATDRMIKIMRRKAIDMLGDEGRWKELFDKYPGKACDLRRGGRPGGVPRLLGAGYITCTIATIDGGIASRGPAI